ncbi:MAG: translocation/assembly module TamB domain-containing protein [Elusimicrobia bacterium]|nr:translocation/assembly module TamB domain-containing protein [Elusimicrobiota bacterium]
MRGGRWAAGGILLAGGLLFVGLSLWQGLLVLHLRLEQQLSQAVGRAVRIERISFTFPSKITVHQVTIFATTTPTGEFIFTAPKVTLSIHGRQLLSVLLHRLGVGGGLEGGTGGLKWGALISKVSFQDGKAVVPLPDDKRDHLLLAHLQGSIERSEPFDLGRLLTKSHSPPAWPSLKAQLQGQVLYHRPGTDLNSIRGLSPLLTSETDFNSIRSLSPLLTSETDLTLIEQVVLKASLSQQGWGGNLAVSGVRMEHLAPLWGHLLPEGLRGWSEGQWAGRLHGELSLGGVWPWQGMAWAKTVKTGTLTAKGIRWQRRAGLPFIGIDGKLRLTANTLRTESLTLTTGKNRVTVMGVIEEVFTDPLLKLSATGKAIDLAALPQCVPDPLWSLIPLTGAAAVQLSVEGPLTYPRVEGAVVVSEGRVGAFPFGQGRFRITYQFGRLYIHEATLPLGEGTVSLQGTVASEQLKVVGKAERLSLTALTHPLGKIPVEGLLNSSWTIRGTLQAPVVSGTLTIPEARLGQRAVERIVGRFHYEAQRLVLRITAPGGGPSTPLGASSGQEKNMFSLELDGLLPPDRLIIERLTMQLFGQEGWQVEGKAVLTKQELTVNRVELRHGSGFIHLRGGMALQGQGQPFWVHGTMKQFRLDPFARGGPSTHSTGSGQAPLRAGGGLFEGTLKVSGQLRRSPWEATSQVMIQGLHVRESSGLLGVGGGLKDHALADFSGILSVNADRATLTAIQWGQALPGHLTLDWKHSPPQWQGELSIPGLPWEEWQTFLFPELREPLAGSFQGRCHVTGRWDVPELHLVFQVVNGRWRRLGFHLTGEARTKGLAVDQFTATSQILPNNKGTVLISGQSDLRQRLVALNLKISDVRLGLIAENLGFPLPIGGTGEGTLSVSGPLARPMLMGSLRGRDLLYGQQALGEWHTIFRWSSPQLTLDEFGIKGPGYECFLQKGSTIDFASLSQGTVHLAGELRNIHIGPVTLFGGMELHGPWLATTRGLDLTGQLAVRRLWLNDHGFEGISLNLHYHEQQLDFLKQPGNAIQVLGTVDLGHLPGLGFNRFRLVRSETGQPLLTVNGQFGPARWQFQSEGRGLDVKTLTELFNLEIPSDGLSDFTITGAGAPAHPELAGTLSVTRGRWGMLSFTNAKTQFSWKDDRFSLVSLRILDRPRYTIVGSGVFPLAVTLEGRQRITAHPIALTFELVDSQLSLLESLGNTVKRATGKVQGHVKILGTLEDPRFQGRFQIQGGALTASQYIRQAKEISLDLEWDGREVRIREARAKIGEGYLQGHGRLLLHGFQVAEYDLHFRTLPTDGVALSIPFLPIPESPLFKRVEVLKRNSYGEPRFDLHLTGPGESPTLEGGIELANTHFNFPPPPSHARVPWLEQWLRRVRWNLRLEAPETTWYENELVNVNLRGNLLFQGRGDDLKIFGRWETIRGRISYFGVEFAVQRAVFSVLPTVREGRIANVPYLEGTAESTARVFDPATRESLEDVITLTINRAPLNEIKPRFSSRSNPRLSQEKILARLTQLDVEQLTPQERQTLFQQQAVRLLDSTLATPFARNLLRRTGLVDEFRVSRTPDPNREAPLLPSGERTSNLSTLLVGTKYTLEKSLSRRVALGYSVRVDELQSRLDLRHEVELSYRWTRNVFVRGTYELERKDASNPPDRRLTVEPRWRFGWDD